MNTPIFPANSPYAERIADDPVFDPAIHLALEQPAQTISLIDLVILARLPVCRQRWLRARRELDDMRSPSWNRWLRKS